jgi:Uma2 family endonuclease
MSSTTTNPTPATPPPAATPPAAKPRRRKRGRSVVIPFVDWETYEQLLKVFEERPAVRLTYDRGDLEIMAPSREHERDGEFLATLVGILTEEFGLPFQPGGSVTLKRKRMKRGLEADKSYWIANAAKLAGVDHLDLKIHPPPDLSIEVDVTRSSLNRLGIYRTLGIGEVWRLDGDDLVFLILGADKKYAQVATSPTFRGVAPTDLMNFVKQARGAADLNIAKVAFRAWLKQHIAGLAAPAAPPSPPPAPPPAP